jgi:transcription elongation GreA/GreB family factor
MSRAFVREDDGQPGTLPERAISPHPNLVTPAGLRVIEARVRALEDERQAARAGGDEALRARVERDLRYWRARAGSARVIAPAAVADKVRFGTRVTVELPGGGSAQTFRLVGEDEADAAQGLLSWVAPLAQALLGKAAGERAPFQGGEVLIVSIEP